MDEQIEILSSRGLIIEDKEEAKFYLLQYSYYNIINVYSKFFHDDKDRYVPNASFNEIRSVHIFDSEIKSVLFKYLLECEKHFKSIMSHRFSEKFKDIPYSYLKTNHYNVSKIIPLTNTIAIFSKVIKEKINSRSKNSVKHYYSNHNDVPLWVLVNYLSFGQIIHLYQHLDNQLRNKIAIDLSKYLEKNSGMKIVLEPKEVENILFNLLDIRNCVAHNNLLFNFKCRNNIKYINSIHLKFGVKKESSRQDIFNMLIIMQCFLEKGQYAILYNTIRKRVRNLRSKIHSIDTDRILLTLGFPNDWYETTDIIVQK